MLNNVAVKSKIAVIGLGYWGPNLVRNFIQFKDADVAVLCDKVLERAHSIKQKFSLDAIVTDDFDDILVDNTISAIIICTPTSTHFDLIFKALTANKHVLAEKPLTTSSFQAAQLNELANNRQLVLMTDSTFLYSPAIHAIQNIISAGMIGNILSLESVRANFGIFRDDADVIWDLGPHDISIALQLFHGSPLTVSAIGRSYTKNNLLSTAYLDLKFSYGRTAHISLSWMSPRKTRLLTVVGDAGIIIYDDTLERQEKVKLYRYTSKFSKLDLQPQEAVILAEHEPLQLLCAEFLRRIAVGDDLLDRANSLQVVKILSDAHVAFNQSMSANSVESIEKEGR